MIDSSMPEGVQNHFTDWSSSDRPKADEAIMMNEVETQHGIYITCLPKTN